MARNAQIQLYWLATIPKNPPGFSVLRLQANTTMFSGFCWFLVSKSCLTGFRGKHWAISLKTLNFDPTKFYYVTFSNNLSF